MNVQFRCNEPFLPGYVDRIYVIFRILITFFFYPVNPVDPVRELRSIFTPYFHYAHSQANEQILMKPHLISTNGVRWGLIRNNLFLLSA